MVWAFSVFSRVASIMFSQNSPRVIWNLSRYSLSSVCESQKGRGVWDNVGNTLMHAGNARWERLRLVLEVASSWLVESTPTHPRTSPEQVPEHSSSAPETGWRWSWKRSETFSKCLLQFCKDFERTFSKRLLSYYFFMFTTQCKLMSLQPTFWDFRDFLTNSVWESSSVDAV